MSNTTVNPMQILVLGQGVSNKEFATYWQSNADIHRVETFDGAIEALGERAYDLLIIPASGFLRFQKSHANRLASAIINIVSQGVCIVGESGEMEWANETMLNYAQDIRQRVCQYCMQTLSWALSQTQSRSTDSDLRSRRFNLSTDDDQQLEVTVTPVLDHHKKVTHVAAVVGDVTRESRSQQQIEAIDQAGRELLSLDTAQFSRLNPQERLSLLEQKILRCTRDLLHFDNFEVRVLDRETQQLDVVLCNGIPQDAPGEALVAALEGNGICGYVAARGQSYICPNTKNDQRYRLGVAGALSSLTVPIWLHDKVVGVVNFENKRLAAFGEDDRQFAEIFGRYIALSLHLLDLLASERHTTTGELGSNILSEITAPLSDILTDVETLVEDYIGHDDLRHRLRAISENAVQIRDSISQMTAAKPGVTGVRSRKFRRRDPVLEGKRVLIADDEEMLRQTVSDVLAGYGCVTKTAPDGEVAIRLIAQESFDLVLSDIRMPHRSGYEVFAAAKDANPATPVILTTGFGYDPNHSIIRARREGLAAVLFKPFKVDQLLNEIRAALSAC